MKMFARSAKQQITSGCKRVQCAMLKLFRKSVYLHKFENL